MYIFVSGGVNYISGPYTTTFSAGTTTTSFGVVISDNDLHEEHVYFNVTIDPSSLPSNVMVGNTAQARVIIVDNDSKCIVMCIL